VQTLGVLVAQTSRELSSSEIIVFGALAALIVGYLYGKYYAVWGRARRDYLRARQSVPGLRKAMLRALWKVVEVGAVVVVTTIVLILFAGAAVPGR
jgi:hypothetical protein